LNQRGRRSKKRESFCFTPSWKKRRVVLEKKFFTTIGREKAGGVEYGKKKDPSWSQFIIEKEKKKDRDHSEKGA